MNLAQFAYACRVFDSMTGYDNSYAEFLEKTNGALELSNSDHRKWLLKWLNKWGCRQFSLDCHQIASDEILTWWNRWGGSLFPSDRPIWDLTDEELKYTALSYHDLSNRVASRRQTGSGESSVRIDPSGAAKILFASRPAALPPWDAPMRKIRGADGGKEGYLKYLEDVRARAHQLSHVASRMGLKITDIPELIGQKNSTVCELINKYLWVTISRDCKLPDADTFKKWETWSRV